MSTEPTGRRRSIGTSDALDRSPDAGAIIDELKTTNRLLALVATKGMEQRQAIILLDSAGFQPMQIATVLGISANAARIALHRARRAAQGRAQGGSGSKEYLDAHD